MHHHFDELNNPAFIANDQENMLHLLRCIKLPVSGLSLIILLSGIINFLQAEQVKQTLNNQAVNNCHYNFFNCYEANDEDCAPGCDELDAAAKEALVQWLMCTMFVCASITVLFLLAFSYFVVCNCRNNNGNNEERLRINP